jgi:hypothetical protein
MGGNGTEDWFVARPARAEENDWMRGGSEVWEEWQEWEEWDVRATGSVLGGAQA